jgi:hypothetical protein
MSTQNFVAGFNNLIKSKQEKRQLRKILLPLFVLLLTGLLAGCIAALPQVHAAPQVPNAPMAMSDLTVSYTEKVATSMFAEGVQIYQCKPSKDDAAKFEWSFVGPEALLYDEAHNELGKHYAGPTWEANDGSKVVGAVKARVDAPNAGAIPWLLLYAKSTEGTGIFSAISSIQRVETTGGQAPQDGCDSTHQGEEARVPYTAVYFFYTAQ